MPLDPACLLMQDPKGLVLVSILGAFLNLCLFTQTEGTINTNILHYSKNIFY